MRRVQLLRTAFAASLLSALTMAAAPAQAGGPTSALLSVPGAGTTSSLYYTDPEYDELAGLVGVDQPGGTFEGTESGGHEYGAGVTITWLIHDVSPWRVDRVYLGGKDGPWIATQVGGSEALWDSPVLWHHPEDGTRLAALLDDLGLGTSASQDPGFDGVAGAPVVENEKAAAPPTTSPSETDEQGWWGAAAWALGGLLGGALLTLGWTRRRTALADAPLGSRDAADGYTEVLAR